MVVLTGCGGGDSDTPIGQEATAPKAGLYFSYPADGQQQVPVSAPVVLRFSSPVGVTSEAVGDLIQLSDDDGNSTDWQAVSVTDDGRSLLLYPDGDLTPIRAYHLDIDAIELADGMTSPRTLRFSTRALREGPKEWVAEDEFRLVRRLPQDEDLDVLDFSTLRLQFSQPLERSTVDYGLDLDDTVQITDSAGDLVDVHMVASGPYLTLDPVEDLRAGETYTLTLKSTIESGYGEVLATESGAGADIAYRYSFVPKPTAPRVDMVQAIPDTEDTQSPLTGRQINQVPVVSTLLGADSVTQAEGMLSAELAFVPDYPRAVPLRVDRASRIEGESIPVKLGGVVFLYDTGTIRFDFITDASGYMIPNPYSNNDDAPRQIRLWMDMAITAEDPRANASITQDLTHVELVGAAQVRDGRMNIDAVGVVEPLLQGAEYASSLLSFHMEEVPPGEEQQGAAPQMRIQRVALQGTGDESMTTSHEPSPSTSSPTSVLAVYPGYPCVMESAAATRNLAAGLAGTCVTDGSAVPLMSLAGNRPIALGLSRPLDRNDMEGRLSVARIDETGQVLESDVPGELNVEGGLVTYMPHHPWRVDALYRYRFVAPEGADLVQYFRGAAPTARPLRYLSTVAAEERDESQEAGMFLEIGEPRNGAVRVSIWPGTLSDGADHTAALMSYPVPGRAEPLTGRISETENGAVFSMGGPTDLAGPLIVLDDGRVAVELDARNYILTAVK
ncbi:Ig-like domain-containing protein [Alloalcanivorax sp. C16-1]